MENSVLSELEKKFKTPLYVFDTDGFARRAAMVAEAFGPEIACCYSIKANPFLLQNIPKEIQKLEVCSPGELAICKRMGIEPGRIIFSGVNKTKADIGEALDYQVGICTAESLLHVDLLQEAAQERNLLVPVLLRLTDGSQFGMDESVFMDVAARRGDYPNLEFVGLHYFTRTQKKSVETIEKELLFLREFCRQVLETTGLALHKIEYGTGLPVDYFGRDPEAFERKMLSGATPALKSLAKDFDLTVEMGRFFAAPCGYYLTKVMDVKNNRGYGYAICDGGSHQLKYYGQGKGMHTPPISLLAEDGDLRRQERYTLCGSLCTPADVLATVDLPQLNPGDVLAFQRAGAYSVMEGTALFLSRELPAVVLCSEEEGAVLVRPRTSTDVWNSPGQPES